VEFLKDKAEKDSRDYYGRVMYSLNAECILEAII
jgi:hypothetical protein